ncbi:fused MFS/spermidine synthase [Micromonospora sp. BRA006-A]|nr:fused MFS/spermidine synthase [Micromonospora sp. BRA006-A]
MALTALHLGGGALTLPRWLASTRPGSAQRVIERDPGVVELVRRRLPRLPPEVVVALGDAREAVAEEPPGAYDVVVADVYRPPGCRRRWRRSSSRRRWPGCCAWTAST